VLKLLYNGTSFRSQRMLRAWEYNKKLFKIHGHDDRYFHGLNEYTDYNYGRFLETYVNEDGSAVLDVGANIGITSVIAASVLPSSSVIALEPGELNFRFLQKNISSNNLTNIEGMRCAVGARDLDNISFEENSVWGSIDQNRPAHSNDPPCITIDSFLQRKPYLDSVSVIKVDVEGFELNVLKGAQEAIKLHSPMFYLELNSWCLTTFGDVNPYRLLEYIGDRFSHCYIVRSQVVGPVLQHIDLATLQGRRDIIYTNMVEGSCVNDLVLSNKLLNL
jgi:FkbM family methyltransferase